MNVETGSPKYGKVVDDDYDDEKKKGTSNNFVPLYCEIIICQDRELFFCE